MKVIQNAVRVEIFYRLMQLKDYGFLLEDDVFATNLVEHCQHNVVGVKEYLAHLGKELKNRQWLALSQTNLVVLHDENT